jgi:CRISPR-associated protein Cas6
MPAVDLLFPARGGSIPLDHGYLLFSALAARLPALHERREVGIFPLKGQAVGSTLMLERGALRLRCPAESIPWLLGLSGNSLELAGQRVMLGAPTVRALAPVPRLSARVVTFKHSLEEQAFRATAQRYLEALTGEACSIQVGRRRVVTVAGTRVVGFGLLVEGLKPTASQALQEQGLGGRRHMGCGLFLPTRVKEGGA